MLSWTWSPSHFLFEGFNSKRWHGHKENLWLRNYLLVMWHQNLVKIESKSEAKSRSTEERKKENPLKQRESEKKNLNFETHSRERMLETRDLKLFGTTITLLSTNEEEEEEEEEIMEFSIDKGGTRDEEEQQQIADKDLLGKRLTDQTEENQNPRTPSFEKETVTTKSSRTEDDQSETSGSEEKTILKKPDEILPCPRCNSMNTKFCYYNNYNVNQPRHFCKNCQRYWTAGGTMRNVPVGAGRRKNKNSPLNYRHISISEAFQMTRSDVSDGLNHPSLKPKGTILTFGPDLPICESMASVLNLADRARNGLHRPEENRISVPCVGGKGDEDSIRPAVRVPSSGELSRVALQERAIQNGHGFPPQMTCYPGPSLPYPWNSAMCSPHFPIPFYPATTYWNCPVPDTWGHPWMFPPSSSSSSSQQGASTSNPDSPTSGKRSRDGEMLRSHISEKDDQGKESNSERGVWTPKTLRIDDPDEAARSSIWSTLGIKNNKADSFSGRSLLKAFLPKRDENNCTLETSQALQANPAALSRSFRFQESS